MDRDGELGRRFVDRDQKSGSICGPKSGRNRNALGFRAGERSPRAIHLSLQTQGLGFGMNRSSLGKFTSWCLEWYPCGALLRQLPCGWHAYLGVMDGTAL